MKPNFQRHFLFFCFLAVSAFALESDSPTAPMIDRVGFPKDYREFEVVRKVNNKEEKKVVTVYANKPAASVKVLTELPYPNGAVFVMETARARTNASGDMIFDPRGNLQPGKVLGLHVMRRESGFGKEYGKLRAGEWEFVEYESEGGFITEPAKSFDCAKCHMNSGKRDFVMRGRFPAEETK